MKKNVFLNVFLLVLTCILLVSCSSNTMTETVYVVSLTPTASTTSTEIPTVTATSTEVPTVTATSTAIPTATATPTESPKCPRKIVLPEDLSVEFGVFGTYVPSDGFPGITEVHIGDNLTSRVKEGEDLSLFRNGSIDASFTMKLDGLLAVNKNFTVFVNDVDFKVSDVKVVYNDDKVFLNKGDNIRIVSNGMIAPSPFLVTVHYELGMNVIQEGELFNIGDESFPILCDQETGHWYVDIQLESQETIFTVNPSHPAAIVDAENIYSLRNFVNYVYFGDLTGMFFLPEQEMTITFKPGAKKSFRLVFFN
jgi:hypothetical protein